MDKALGLMFAWLQKAQITDRHIQRHRVTQDWAHYTCALSTLQQSPAAMKWECQWNSSEMGMECTQGNREKEKKNRKKSPSDLCVHVLIYYYATYKPAELMELGAAWAGGRGPMAGGRNGMSFRIPSYPNRSMILWLRQMPTWIQSTGYPWEMGHKRSSPSR